MVIKKPEKTKKVSQYNYRKLLICQDLYFKNGILRFLCIALRLELTRPPKRMYTKMPKR